MSVFSLSSLSALRRSSFALCRRTRTTSLMPSRLSSVSVSDRDVLALDFDGVLCASAAESSFTAVRAAAEAWDIHVLRESASVDTQQRDESTVELRTQRLVERARPAVETGFENVLLARYFYEQIVSAAENKNNDNNNNSNNDSNNNNNGKDRPNTDDVLAERVLQCWGEEMREKLLVAYNVEREHLVRLYARTRDAEIAEDISRWARRNKIYSHVLALLQGERETHTLIHTHTDADAEKKTIALDKERVFVVTTKQERFVRAILSQHALDRALLREGVSNTQRDAAHTPLTQRSNVFDLENIFGNKARVLARLYDDLSQQICINNNNNNNNNNNSNSNSNSNSNEEDQSPSPLTIHFVEDRSETLLRVLRLREEKEFAALRHVRLYLVDYGYNTHAQRERVRESLRDEITLLSAEEFSHLLSRFAKKTTS